MITFTKIMKTILIYHLYNQGYTQCQTWRCTTEILFKKDLLPCSGASIRSADGPQLSAHSGLPWLPSSPARQPIYTEEWRSMMGRGWDTLTYITVQSFLSHHTLLVNLTAKQINSCNQNKQNCYLRPLQQQELQIWGIS